MTKRILAPTRTRHLERELRLELGVELELEFEVERKLEAGLGRTGSPSLAGLPLRFFSGVVWRAVVWCDGVWCCVAWCPVVRYGVAPRGGVVCFCDPSGTGGT